MRINTTKRLSNIGKNKTFFVMVMLLLFASYSMSAKNKDKINTSINNRLYIDNALQDRLFIGTAYGHLDNMKTLHLFSHGKPGMLFIDNKWLNPSEIAHFIQAQIKGGNPKITNINIYGCEFAKGKLGLEAVAYLENKLGLSISASNNITGKDGDWILEVGHQTPNTVALQDYKYNLQCSGNVGSMLPEGDFDGDGICNSADYDDDNDGIPDSLENLSSCSMDSSPVNYIPPQERSVYNPSGYELSSNELRRISDVDSGTQYSASAAGLPSINRVFFTIKSSTVKQIRIYNFLNGNVGNTATAHIKRINSIQLFNATGEMVYDSGTIYPTTITASTYYGVDISPEVEGVTSVAINGLVASSSGFGLRDIFLVGCSYDFDGDGFPNKFDVDSDNDGCPDAVESNAFSATRGYKFTQLDRNLMIDTSQFPIGTNSGISTYGVPGSNRNNPLGTYNAGQQMEECNPCWTGSSMFSDHDADGVGDKCDLDNDNDGIPDSLECPGGGDFSSEPVTFLDLSNTTIVSDVTVGDYIGPSLKATNAAVTPDGTCIDVLITVEQKTKGVPEYFEWNTTPTDGTKVFNGRNYCHYEFKVYYFQCGTSIPVELSTIYTVRDLDGDCDWNNDGIIDNPECNTTGGYGHDEYIYVPTGQLIDYNFNNPTHIYTRSGGYTTYFHSAGSDYGSFTAIPGRPVTLLSTKFYLHYKKSSNFSFTFYTGKYGGVFMDFTFSDEALPCDCDNDGIPSNLDLDSDNDGIYDAVEAGVSSINTNGTANGTINSSTGAPSNAVSSLPDTDNDGISNICDLDSDGDTCTDANEAYNNANTDAGDGGQYGTIDADPSVGVDNNGLVDAATYTSTTYANVISEGEASTITTQPEHKEACVGETVEIGVGLTAGSGTTTYQWQESTDSGTNWNNLSNNTVYSGVDTATLTIANVQVSSPAKQYRFVTVQSNFICGEVISSVATLTVNSRPTAPISGGNQTQCVSSPVQTLTATATAPSGSTVVWYDAATNGNVVSMPTLNAVGTITYYAESVNSTTGCISTSRTPIILTINELPTANAGSDATINCTTPSAQLEATGGT
ncbi:MAG: DUF4347 domain-containing protein, partial [Aestuariibaculum sp.]